MTGKDAALLHTGNQKQKQKNQGYASTLKECIKTEKQASIHGQKVCLTQIF